MQRKVASNIFTRSSFRGYMSDVFTKHSLKLGEVIERDLKDGSRIDLQQLMFSVTLDVIGEIGFGCELHSLGAKEPKAFAVSFDSAQDLMARRFIRPFWNIPVLGRLVYKAERDLIDHVTVLDNFAYEIIGNKKKEMLGKPSETETDSKSQDILSLFMAEKLGLSDRLLRDVVMSFMIAGRDTTACTLTFLLFLFAQNPETQQKAREEVKSIMGDKKVASSEDVASMKYLWGCVLECLRLYPPVPTDSKVCVEEDTLPNGGKVYPGQRVSFESFCMGRLLPMWKDDEPLKFKPERWLNMDKLPTAYEFPVFQAGPRVCLGQSFAMVEAEVVSSYLLNAGYWFDLIENQTYDYAAGITLSMKDGLFLKISKREFS